MKVVFYLMKIFGGVVIAASAIWLLVVLALNETSFFSFSLPLILLLIGSIIVSWSCKHLNLRNTSLDVEPEKTVPLPTNNWLTKATSLGSISLLALIIVPILLWFMLTDGNQEHNPKTTQNSSVEISQSVKESMWMEKGKDAVKSKLKDANSATFRKVFFHLGADNIPMTCGEVNSKNSFGGFTGYQRFVSAGKANLTFLQEQVSDFNTIWNKFCR